MDKINGQKSRQDGHGSSKGSQYKFQQPYWFMTLLRAKDRSILTEGVPALIDISGKSNQYLCKCFKRFLNKTPSRYINEKRIQYAKELLVNTGLPIIEVALEAGYDNLSHFYHVFKAFTDMTPASYRYTHLRGIFEKELISI
ncbi:helix-turn-helix transcriptional regulator [Vallitalea pronyensis]|uniref:Helix-turn-helix transcriptional regulator n=1 Tax=Vallitalea pronyensis TaxID=1348613 RepID=A0A8J8SF39_9FIRM|nr:helix-turn-helix transcriptional regulator [Vallitalea pronyensis]QUI21027.1 helix-turn-helix transcriptional regulator [Vallitalea pronyensis]